MTEPEFWDDRLLDEPCCSEFLSNWEILKRDVSFAIETYPQFFVDYPKYKITLPGTDKRVRMYENDWKVTAWSKFDELYSEVDRVGKKLGDNVERLLNRYIKKNIPETYAIIEKYQQQEILANVFVSILSPESVIHPHQGHSKEYMRCHIGLVCDPECKITVGETTRTWEPGKLIAFKDGGPYYHSVRHEGTQDRIIFSFDLKLDYLKQYIPEL